MKKIHSVEEYIETHENYSDALILLRNIITSTELEEAVKWSAPTYSVNGKKVLAIGAFKHHFGVWFFNGVFLKDEHNLLEKAQETTKGLRQMRFKSIKDINKDVVLAYVKEAIANQKAGKEIKPDRSKKKTIIPPELQTALDHDTELMTGFNALTPSKQREYCEHIASAKREQTKLSRLEKIKPMILQGVGLHDKYKNC